LCSPAGVTIARDRWRLGAREKDEQRDGCKVGGQNFRGQGIELCCNPTIQMLQRQTDRVHFFCAS
jgi:hypothetical protein